jgi:hypothetical protein
MSTRVPNRLTSAPILAIEPFPKMIFVGFSKTKFCMVSSGNRHQASGTGRQEELHASRNTLRPPSTFFLLYPRTALIRKGNFARPPRLEIALDKIPRGRYKKPSIPLEEGQHVLGKRN